MKQNKHYPILMADIIKSRRIESNQLLTEFGKLVRAMNKKWSSHLLSPLTITLGDEFQGIADTMENGYKIIFDIDEYIVKKELNLKLRYVLNFGIIDTPINHKLAHGMLGAGLTESREKLNRLKSGRNRFCIVNRQNRRLEHIVSDLFLLYENYVDNWKHSEYPIIKEFLMERTYQQVAESMNVYVSSAWRRHKSLNIEEYSICKKLILKLNATLHDESLVVPDNLYGR